MGKHNAAARRYLREIGGWLPCAGKMKRNILDKIKTTMDGYLAENPGAAYAELLERFGTPQQIASSYVDETETGELLRNLRVRRKIVRIVTAAALAVVVLWAGVVFSAWAKHQKSDNGRFEVTITGQKEPIEQGGNS